MHGVKVTPARCAAGHRDRDSTRRRSRMLPRRSVTFRVGRDGVSEVLVSASSQLAAAALGNKLPAGCAHYSATVDGKIFRYSVRAATADRPGDQARALNVKAAGLRRGGRLVGCLPGQRVRRRGHHGGPRRHRGEASRPWPATLTPAPRSHWAEFDLRCETGDMTDASPRFRSVLDGFPAYQPGRTPVSATGKTHKLSSNESPYPPLPSVVEAIAEAARSVNRYPDNGAQALIQAIADKFGVPPRTRRGRVRLGRRRAAAPRGRR